MPSNRRYRSDSWQEQRAMDKYYEYLEEACDCWLNVDDDPVGAELPPEMQCHYCRRRERIAAEEREERLARAEQIRAAAAARLAANPDKEQITTIKSYLDRVAAIRGEGREGERVAVIRELFTYLLTVGDFLKKHAKFRQAVRNKMAEFRGDARAESLYPLFDQTEELLVSVEAPPAAAAAAAAATS